MGEQIWDYRPDVFNNIDTNHDGLLNPTELDNYYKNLYPDAETQASYESVNDVLTKADLNGDGLISKGELALYKSGEDYLDKDIFTQKVVTDETKVGDIPKNQQQWEDLKKEYNIYDSADIISKGEIIDYDKELNRKALSFSSATFNAADANRDGFLDQSEMKTYLGNMYGNVSDTQINYTFDQLDANKDGRVSDGEFALFKLNNESDITSDKLVNAGYSKSDADALVKKYAPEGQASFSKDSIVAKDDQLSGKPVDNTKDGMSVGGIIALIACCVIVIGLIAWGIWWLSKDGKKKKETTTEIRKIRNNVGNNLQTINGKGKTITIT